MFGSSRTSLTSFSHGVSTLSEKTKLTLDTMSQQFLLNLRGIHKHKCNAKHKQQQLHQLNNAEEELKSSSFNSHVDAPPQLENNPEELYQNYLLKQQEQEQEAPHSKSNSSRSEAQQHFREESVT